MYVKNINGNIVISNLIKVYLKNKVYFKISDIYLDTPICNNHAFPPGLLRGKLFLFFQWKHMGTILDL